MPGKRTILNIMALTLIPAAFAIMAFAGDVDFSGKWITNFGVLNMKQEGARVAGEYEIERSGGSVKGKLEGEAKGYILNFKWTQEPSWAPPDDGGDGYFIMKRNNGAMEIWGKWRYGYSGPWEGEWSGKPASAPPAHSVAVNRPIAAPPTPPRAGGGSMAFVPAGKFIMGMDGEDALYNEGPSRRVYVDEFYIDKYEVTNEEFDRCAKSGPCWDSDAFYYKGFDGPTQPVVGVSAYQADDYCKWVGKRLPTEAEWEKAARGADGRTFPWGEKLNCSTANYGLCGHDKTMPVGSYKQAASPYGAFDMAGNVAEWTADWYDSMYHNNTTARNPRVTISPESLPMNMDRTFRGGSWRHEYASSLRTSARESRVPISREDFIGFRCVK